MKEHTVKVYDNGNTFGCKNDKCQRKNGRSIEWRDGNTFWYMNEKLHREDGPAIERADGHKEWFRHGERHREDGPAVELDGYKEWWVDGKRVTKAEFMNFSLDGKVVDIDGKQYRLVAL